MEVNYAKTTVTEVAAKLVADYKGCAIPHGENCFEVYIASTLTKPGIRVMVEQLPEDWGKNLDKDMEWIRRRRG
jgi:hypothetical protein